MPQNPQKKYSKEAQNLIDLYLKPAQDKRLKEAEAGAIKKRNTIDTNIAKSQAGITKDALAQNRLVLAAEKSAMKTRDTIDDRFAAARPPSAIENANRLASLNKEISRLSNLKSVPDESLPGDADYDFVQSVNRAKVAHMARLIAEKNSLEPTSTSSDTSKVDPAKNIADMTTANPDSVAAVLAQLSMEPAKIDSSKKAEAEKKKNDPNNFSTNQKTNFRKAWRKKNAKALNSKDPKVSTPAKLKYQQLKDWRDGKIPFPDTLKNEL